MTTIRIQLLGKAMTFDHNKNIATLPAKAEELFFYLLLCNLNHHQCHEREALCALLWADQSPDRAKKYLRQSLWQLQSAFSHDENPNNAILEMDGNWVHLNESSVIWLDVEQLVETFTQVRDVADSELTPEQATQIQNAIKLYQGDLLTGWYQDWCILERERCQSMVLVLLDKLIGYALSQGAYADGIDYARRILQLDSARERTHRALMRLHYLANDRSAALRQFEHCTNALMRELSVKPAKRTIALHQQIQADQLDEQWLSQSLGRADQPPPLLNLPASPAKEASHTILTQIHQLLSTMHQDIALIKQTVRSR